MACFFGRRGYKYKDYRNWNCCLSNDIRYTREISRISFILFQHFLIINSANNRLKNYFTFTFILQLNTLRKLFVLIRIYFAGYYSRVKLIPNPLLHRR